MPLAGIPTWLRRAEELRRAKNKRSWAKGKISAPAAARASREELRRELGDACVRCGAKASLVFYRSHTGCDPMMRTMNRWTRMKLYWSAFREGNLELVCKRCLYMLLGA